MSCEAMLKELALFNQEKRSDDFMCNHFIKLFTKEMIISICVKENGFSQYKIDFSWICRKNFSSRVCPCMQSIHTSLACQMLHLFNNSLSSSL